MTKVSYINAAISALELLSKEDIKHTAISDSLIGTALDSLDKAREIEENSLSFNAQGVCDIITSLDDCIQEEVGLILAEGFISGQLKREKIWEVGSYVSLHDEFKDWVKFNSFNSELVLFGNERGIEVDLEDLASEFEYDDMAEFIQRMNEKTADSFVFNCIPSIHSSDGIAIYGISNALINH